MCFEKLNHINLFFINATKTLKSINNIFFSFITLSSQDYDTQKQEGKSF
jgi:hypothetical protein